MVRIPAFSRLYEGTWLIAAMLLTDRNDQCRKDPRNHRSVRRPQHRLEKLQRTTAISKDIQKPVCKLIARRSHIGILFIAPIQII